jgi:hypothetical protein
MGCVRPPDVIEVRVPLRVGLIGFHHPTAIVLVKGHLPGQKKPGSQPRGLSTQRHHGGHAAGISDSAGGDDRHRRHRVHHRSTKGNVPI